VNRRRLLSALGGAAFTGPIALAQQPTGIPRIGVLMGASPSDEAVKLDEFRAALKSSATSTARPY
jgi:hypothetical protein